MATELFANNYVTTLASAMTSGATTAVMSASVPTGLTTSGGQWRLLIDNEIMLVTSVNGDGVTLTVTRAQEGTGATAHSSGATAAQILTAAALTNLTPTGGASSGVISSEPVAGTAGRLYLATDADRVDLDSGSAWSSFGPLFSLTPPVPANFTWVNQGSATVTTSKGGIFLGTAATAPSFIMQVQATPTPPYTATIAFFPLLTIDNTVSAIGMVLRDSVSGKLMTLALEMRTASPVGLSLFADKFTDSATFSATYASGISPFIGALVWLRIVDDATNRKYQYSNDGLFWHTIFSVLRTDFVTPNQIGFCVQRGGVPSGTFGLNVVHWSVTTP